MSQEPRVVGLVTARGGEQSIPRKNLLPIGGRPIVEYPLDALAAATSIERSFVSTNDEEIAAVARRLGADALMRPRELSEPSTNHGRVIVHEAERIAQAIGEYDLLVVLLGNTVMCAAEDIDACVAATIDQDVDACMTVWEAGDDHPLRALRRDATGILSSYTLADGTVDTNRQSYPPAYFYDQGPWACRLSSLRSCARGESSGPGPWWWMGPRCTSILRPWVTGRDINTEFDIAVAENWVAGGWGGSGR